MSQKLTAAHTLRELIAGGRWRPGDRLPAERELAAGLRISRSAAREALRELATQGLVEVRRGAGSYVARVDAVELAEIRLALEPLAARLAAERHTADQAAHFEALLVRLRDSAADPPAFASADLELHTLVVRASGNSVLERVHDQLAALLTLSRGVTAREHGRLRHTLVQHEDLVAAILARDPSASARAMRRHIQSVMRSAQSRDLDSERLAFGGFHE